MRRPIDDPVRITGDRASHAEYGVGPATDYGCDIGTPVRAPFAGRLRWYATTEGGLGVIIDGALATFYGQHLSARSTPGDYAEGDTVALSGNTGTLTYGPHLHCYVIVHATGERLAMEEYLTQFAGDNSRPFAPPVIEEIDMSDARLIHSTSPERNATVLAAPGHWHVFTAEEWSYFSEQKGLNADIPIIDVDGNPRAYDLLHNIYAPNQVTAEQVEAIITKAGVSISNLNAADIARAVNDDAANRMRT